MLVIATVRCSPAISSFSRVGRPFIMKSFVEIKVLLVLLQLDRQCTEALTDLLKGSLVTAVRIRGGWRLCLYIRSHVIRGLYCTWFMMMALMWLCGIFPSTLSHMLIARWIRYLLTLMLHGSLWATKPLTENFELCIYFSFSIFFFFNFFQKHSNPGSFS